VFREIESLTLFQNIVGIPTSWVVIGTKLRCEVAARDDGSERNDFGGRQIIAMRAADCIQTGIGVGRAKVREPVDVGEVTGDTRLVQVRGNCENETNLCDAKAWINMSATK
jgi:hypothetical protein